jgi:four helix bundle protein
METFRFQNFKVYREAKEFNREIYLLARTWDIRDRGLMDQLIRASISICLNIAEGSAKGTDKDFRRYIQNALGSLNEVVACLDIALSIGLLSGQKYGYWMIKASDIAKQLGGFSRKLRASS